MYAPKSLLAVAFTRYAAADFHIYHANTISTVPDAPGGYEAYLNNLDFMNCDQVLNTHGVSWVGDASGGGARCEGCLFDAESIDAWDITEFEFKNDDVITWDEPGWITLRKEQDNPERYWFEYVNEARDESGVITNSYCVRDGSTELGCNGGTLSNYNVKKIFACYTSFEAVSSP
ncbi:hypothetical protein B0I35DRAFT_415111 [Stachybotrys elegans]|uniref:Uncharacterized protein n=1 Tax=Stachybotrys elegans TaxID=80388 RepID=A0A8K0WK22_9HYPO|nr:hypothetical protein B0I35DRAFT_415111 [Stachybotrys elegans]